MPDDRSRAGLVDQALATGKLYEGAGFKYISSAFAQNTLHLMGLLSDGGVHSRLDQLLVSVFQLFSAVSMSGREQPLRSQQPLTIKPWHLVSVNNPSVEYRDSHSEELLKTKIKQKITWSQGAV